jgi:hypothetical protein
MNLWKELKESYMPAHMNILVFALYTAVIGMICLSDVERVGKIIFMIIAVIFIALAHLMGAVLNNDKEVKDVKYKKGKHK